jgi:hypothetical protein
MPVTYFNVVEPNMKQQIYNVFDEAGKPYTMKSLIDVFQLHTTGARTGFGTGIK